MLYIAEIWITFWTVYVYTVGPKTRIPKKYDLRENRLPTLSFSVLYNDDSKKLQRSYV